MVQVQCIYGWHRVLVDRFGGSGKVFDGVGKGCCLVGAGSEASRFVKARTGSSPTICMERWSQTSMVGCVYDLIDFGFFFYLKRVVGGVFMESISFF